MNRLLFLVVVLAGCVTTNDRPSAVRSGSYTDRRMNESVLKHIRFLEKADGRGDCAIEVLRIEDRGKELSTLIEFWIVRSCGVKTVYKVRKAPLSPGRYKYIVTYPSAADLMTVE